jgi:hypothetical protein
MCYSFLINDTITIDNYFAYVTIIVMIFLFNFSSPQIKQRPMNKPEIGRPQGKNQHQGKC